MIVTVIVIDGREQDGNPRRRPVPFQLFTSKQLSLDERDVCAAYLFAISRNELERHQYANIVNQTLIAARYKGFPADGTERA